MIRQGWDGCHGWDVSTGLMNFAPRPMQRAETTYLNIIGAMLTLMLGKTPKTPTGEPQSIFDNQSVIIAALLEHFDKKPGISARTLEDKFAAAKRSLTAT